MLCAGAALNGATHESRKYRPIVTRMGMNIVVAKVKVVGSYGKAGDAASSLWYKLG
jgi:hypothetical protein